MTISGSCRVLAVKGMRARSASIKGQSGRLPYALNSGVDVSYMSLPYQRIGLSAPSFSYGGESSVAVRQLSVVQSNKNGTTGALPTRQECPRGWIPFSDTRAERGIPKGCWVA